MNAPTLTHPTSSPTVAAIHGKLMQGVSYAIPFVVTGGVLLALGYALGGPAIGTAPPVTAGFDWLTPTSWAALLHQLGTLTFGLLVPVVGGYVAHAIADLPALVPGFVGGTVAAQTGAGFLGGLVAGVLAGVVVDRLARWRPPRAVAGLRPVLVLPLAGTLVTGAVMWLVVATPLAALTSALTSALAGLSTGSLVLAGAALGLMAAVDLGGPINKTAYTFAVAGLATGAPSAQTVMAAVMAAGMTPPLAMALATALRPHWYTPAERENGRAAWLLGAVYVTEGAIPFAAADPLRVLPSLLAGSAVTGGLSAAFGAAAATPHGGIFVLPLVGNPFGYLVAIAAGTLVSTAAVLALKSALEARERRMRESRSGDLLCHDP
jgi:fructose PTS system EIIBC or EIIC component